MAVSLDDVVKELQNQNAELKAQTQNFAAVKAQLLKDARQKKQDRLDDLEAKRKESRSLKSRVMAYGQEGKGLKGSLKTGLMEGTGVSSIADLLKGMGLGVTGAALAGALARGMGKALGRGALAGIVGLFGEQIIESALKGLSVDDIFNLNNVEMEGLASDINGALVKGIVASIFGKKFGIAVFIGDLISKAISSSMSKETLEKKLGTINLTDEIKYDITNEDLITLGSVAAAFFGPGLIYGAITKGLGGQALAYPGAKVGRDPKTGRFMKLKPQMKESFVKGFGGRFLGGAALFTMGNALGAYLDDAANESAGDVARWTSGGMALGSMFGPKGMLVGAVAGLMIGLGRIVLDYIRETDDSVRNAALAKAEQALKESGGDASKLSERQRKDVAQAIQELEKLSLKMKPQDQEETLKKIEEYKKLLQLGPEALAATAFETAKIEDFIKAAMARNSNIKTVKDMLGEFSNLQQDIDLGNSKEDQAKRMAVKDMLNKESSQEIIKEFLKSGKLPTPIEPKPTPLERPVEGPDVGDRIDPNKTSDVTGDLRGQGMLNSMKGEILSEEQKQKDRLAETRALGGRAPVTAVDAKTVYGPQMSQNINLAAGKPNTIDRYGIGSPSLGWT